jgi:hypothetical protein
MGIVTQAALTSLRTLKYGSDTPGGGNSGEPYITQKIPPAFEQQVPSTNIWNSDNGLIRGGFTGATRASGLDALRIGKFLVDPPRGPLFIAKQVGLQLSNPQLETRTDALGQLLGSVGPTRIYNLGINTLAQVPVNAFGGHIVRHGLSPVLNEGQIYSKVVVANDAVGTFGANNRLVLLKNKLQTYPDSNIAQYVGGPDSVDGIGTTTIRRTVNTLSNPQFNQYLQSNEPNTAAIVSLTNTQLRYPRPAPDVDYFLAQGVSEQYFNGNVGLIGVNNKFKPKTGTDNTLLQNNAIDQTVINYPAAGRIYNSLIKAIDTQTSGSRLGNASVIQANKNSVGNGTINNQYDVTSPITFAYTGKSKYKGLPLVQYNLEARVGSGRQDQINLTPLYIDSAPPGTSVTIGGQPYNVRDLIKFRIEAVDNTTPNNSVWMVFRAYLKDLNDNPNPSYNTINYVGRGEPFYIYNGFSRDISFTFQVAALSEAEMQPMWQKLNYLMSTVMPDYDTISNVMKGSYTKLTIGNYIYRQPGIIKSLNYKINNNTPWEIAIDDPEITGGSTMYELPQVMDVSITFAPIHNFLPRKFPEKYAGGEAWKDLPAFVVDRDDPTNQNAWLTNIFNNGKEIPTNTTSTAIKK